jgi:hypothetical protein
MRWKIFGLHVNNILLNYRWVSLTQPTIQHDEWLTYIIQSISARGFNVQSFLVILFRLFKITLTIVTVASIY